MKKKLTEMTFEEALARLEEIVQTLEEGDVPLEQAIDLFQEGIGLSKHLNTQLDSVEQRIEILMEEDGEFVKKPFDSEED